MTVNDFSVRLSRMPDEELVRIAHSKPEDGFVVEAISAAQQEIERRGLKLGHVAQVIDQISADPEEFGNREHQPLRKAGKVGFFMAGLLFGIPLAVFWAVGGLGYKRKMAEGFRWALGGFVTNILLTVLISTAIYA